MSEYPVRVIRDVLIPMRDGVHLAGNLYLPENAGPVPAILQYTPYLKDGAGGRGPTEMAQKFFAAHGYACLTLDMRGFGASEGIAAPPFSPSEKQDGFDALAWLASQPWCSGSTGIWGISYGGDTSLSVASTRPPSLKAIVPIHAIDDEFTGVCYPHGCRGGLWGEINWGLRMVGYQLLPPLRFGNDRRWAKLWHQRLEQIEPCPFTWHTIPPATWREWRTDVRAIQAATYAVSAWHDSYPLETATYYDAISAPKRLLLGPWKHEMPDRAAHHPIGFLSEMLRWWDFWLKGIANGVMDELPVTIFHQPDGWQSDVAWPIQNSAVQDYFLQPNGTLGQTAPTEDGADAYLVDPTVGLTHLPWDWTTSSASGPVDVSSDDHRALTYTTPPLTSDLDLAGNAEVVLEIAADQPDFPLVAWLSDVSPSGFSTLICRGWVRPTHQVGAPLTPGQVYELTVPFFPTVYRVPAGHRLRLAIAGAYFPVLVSAPINPMLTVYHHSKARSRLRLPVATSGTAISRPTFPPPFAPPVETLVSTKGDHNVSRDLFGGNASYRQERRTVHRLEGGTMLTMDHGMLAKIDTQSPGDFVLQGTCTMTVERPTDTIVIRCETIETFDHSRITADISLDGRPFYHRTWDLDLQSAAWNLRLATTPRSS